MLEVFGVAAGLLCVVLLARQNILTWPIGLLYAAVSLVVFARSGIYGQVLLHVVFVLLNAWGWVAWSAQARADETAVQPSSPRLWLLFAVSAIAAACLIQLVLNRWIGGLGGWLDAIIAAGSLVAIWMQSRRYLDVWIVWFVLNLGSMALYVQLELYGYALLYLVYQVLAVWGYREWRKDLPSAEVSATSP